MSLGCIDSQIASVRVRGLALHQVVLLQIELQDGVFDGGEDEADVLCVGGAGEMRVDDLIAVWVQVHKHLEDKLAACLGVPLRTCGAASRGLLVTKLPIIAGFIHFESDANRRFVFLKPKNNRTGTLVLFCSCLADINNNCCFFFSSPSYSGK